MPLRAAPSRMRWPPCYGWDGELVLSGEKRARLISQVPEADREDIQFAHRQIRRFAEAQRDTIHAPATCEFR